MENKARAMYFKELDCKKRIKRLMGQDCPFESFVNRDCDEVLDFRRALSLERISWYRLSVLSVKYKYFYALNEPKSFQPIHSISSCIRSHFFPFHSLPS